MYIKAIPDKNPVSLSNDRSSYAGKTTLSYLEEIAVEESLCSVSMTCPK